MTEGASPGIVAVNLHVGTHVHVEGSFAKGTGVFTAKAIQILPTPASIEKAKIEGAGLIQELPQLHKDGQHWIGMLWIDGYPLQLTEQTKIASPDGSAFPADRIGTNFWAEYRAERQEDHSLRATSIQVVPLHIAADEVKFRESSEPVIERPDYTKKVPGKIKWRLNWALNILPERAIQDYVAGVGSRLIPQYQKSLPASDPAKIDFQFYVVQQPSKWKEALWAGAINEASATAGGLVFLPDTVLAVMDNEAQLAALLSNCIAVTLERQYYAHRTRMSAQRDLTWVGMFPTIYALPLNVGNKIAINNLMLHINEQASRIGLRYMLQNGYDIREAPFAWTVAANQKANNPHAPDNIPPLLVQSLMSGLRLDYDGIDYASLKANREAYQQMLAQLRAEAAYLPKPKNHQ